MHQFFGKIGSPVFLFEEYPSLAYLFSPNYWAANLSRRGGMHSVLAKEYGQCLLKVISKGVENSKNIIANGILVSFFVLVLH